jgi:hypothetical protein
MKFDSSFGAAFTASLWVLNGIGDCSAFGLIPSSWTAKQLHNFMSLPKRSLLHSQQCSCLLSSKQSDSNAAQRGTIHNGRSATLLRSAPPSGEDDVNEKEDEDIVFYDDFGGSIIGDSGDDGLPSPFRGNGYSSSNTGGFGTSNSDAPFNMDALQSRISRTKSALQQRDARLARNWSSGNWSVRGFALDKYDPIRSVRQSISRQQQQEQPREDPFDLEMQQQQQQQSQEASSDEENEIPIVVSKIALDIEATHTDAIDDEEDTLLAVGRTDGSVLIMKLGNEYMTSFQAVPNLSFDTENQNDTGDDDMSQMKFQSKLVRSDELFPPSPSPGDKADDWTFDDEGGDPTQSPVPEAGASEPFEILQQFQAVEDGAPITSLLFDGQDIFTAGGSSGIVHRWYVGNEIESGSGSDSGPAVQQVKVYNAGAHSSHHAIISIHTLPLSTSDSGLLVTVSAEGSFALWDRASGDLILRVQVKDPQYGETLSILSSDVYEEEEDDNETAAVSSGQLFLGLSNGHVTGYTVNELLAAAAEGRQDPIPSLDFLAHQGRGATVNADDGTPVTAIKCLGQGTLALQQQSQQRPSGMPQKSNVLLTGGKDGMVKQW